MKSCAGNLTHVAIQNFVEIHKRSTYCALMGLETILEAS